jgi:hypothetical protein
MKRYLLIINIVLLFLALVVSLIVGLFLLSNFRATPASAAAAPVNDKIPPIIFNSKIDNITASSATILWQTDKQADSLVNYGLNRSYGLARDPIFDKTSHKIILDELLPATTYFFRIISTDDEGNQAISSDFSFVTPGTENAQVSQQPGQYPGSSQNQGQQSPGSSEQTGQQSPGNSDSVKQQVTQILEQINKVTDTKALEVIQKQIQEQARQVTQKLEIIFDQVDVETGVDYAIVRWKTSEEASSIVSLVTEKDYNINNANTYVWQEGNYEEQVTDHAVRVNGLTPSTTYHFQVSSKTILGVAAESTDKVFVTKSILPEIYNITVAKIEETAATINFATNIPCSAFIAYTNLDTGEAKMQGSSDYSIVHSIRIDNLNYDTYYSALITAESEAGDKVQSPPFTFLTIRDVVPPVISKVNTESTLYPGADTKVQTIVSWETDEEAVCQFSFHQGFNAAEKVDVLPIEADYTKKHVTVTTNLLPSTVYKFWVECYDKVQNKTRTSDYIMLTPTREQNIFDIILKNFESTFGWVNGKK